MAYPHPSRVHCDVNPGRTSTLCIDDAPSPEAIREVAEHSGLPVGRITQLSVFDPCAYGA
jgi:hypothetical protein